MELRPYQRDAVDALFAFWGKGGGNPLIEIPTGGGKSAVIGEICRRLVQDYQATVLVATHRRELLTQDEAAIKRVWPVAPVGVYSSGLARREVRQITVAGVQSICRKPRILGRVDVVLIDEAHLVPPKGNGQYRMLFDRLRDVNAEIRVVGLTATPYRLGQGLLTEGDGRIFDCIVYRAKIKALIDDGYLSPLVSATATAAIGTDTVTVRQGEFAARELELAANVTEVTDAVVRDVQATGRKHVLVFGCGVEHAAHMRNAFRFAGYSAETVSGETPPAQRHAILEAFKAGRLQVLTSCDVLTTGFDSPNVDCLAIVRPTLSPALFVQMVGRGARLSPGKTNCVVLDYGGNLARHGAVDQIEPRSKALDPAPGSKTALCPQCFGEMAIAKRTCPHCGHVRPLPTRQERKANRAPSSLQVVSGEKKQKILAITDRIVIDYVSLNSGKRMLRVDYFTGESATRAAASEFVCLEHEGYAWEKAAAWWTKMTGNQNIPANVDEAMERLEELRPVRGIKVMPDGKHQRVVGWAFGKTRQPGEDDDEPDSKQEVDPDEDLPF